MRIIRYISGCVILCVLVIVLAYYFLPDRKERYTIVLATNPVSLLTLDAASKTGTLILIPESLAIDAAYSAGRYPIASLWKMGAIDSRDRSLLSDSVSVAFGIPVEGYIGGVSGALDDSHPPVELMRSYFSFTGILSAFLSQDKTNLAYRSAFSTYRILRSIDMHSVKVLHLDNLYATFDETLADDSSRKVLDTQKTDVILKNVFTIQSIRKEALSIGLVNTTKVPDFAGKIARQLTNSGMFVISLDNADAALKECQVSGPKKSLESETGRFLQLTYHCKPVESITPQREDLIVKLGTELSAMHKPR